MIRGTDTAYRFKLPCAFSDLEWVNIMFWQDNYYGQEGKPLPITKTIIDCGQSDGDRLIVRLTAEETARFSDKRKAYVQMLANHGATFGTKKYEITVYSMNDELIDVADQYIVIDGGVVTNEDMKYIVLDGDNIE